jgi:uncharacterized protein with GYD domain
MRIVRELAAEGNPVAKIAFLTRLSEEAVREVLGLAAASCTDARVRAADDIPHVRHDNSAAAAQSNRLSEGGCNTPVFVTMGRYSENAVKGMLAKPEDRSAAAAKLVEQAGGKLLGFYMLFGEYDWMSIYEVPSGKEAAAAVLTVAGGGAATDVKTKTMLAMTGSEAKAAFGAGQALGAAYRAPGSS